MRKVVETKRAPAAIGPYSQAIIAQGLVWVSGQIALDPETGTLVPGGIEDEARQVLRNLDAVLHAAGSDRRRVIIATIYLIDMGDFETVNRVYGSFFSEEPPARACVEVSALPRGARVEIDVVALS